MCLHRSGNISKPLIANNVTIARGLNPDCRQPFPVDRATEAWNLIQTKAEPVLGIILDRIRLRTEREPEAITTGHETCETH